MLRLAVIVVGALVGIGAMIIGALPHTLGGMIHDLDVGWHWFVVFVHHQLAHKQK
jgi:hypothetical protein